jgi:hypothetical protein
METTKEGGYLAKRKVGDVKRNNNGQDVTKEKWRDCRKGIRKG